MRASQVFARMRLQLTWRKSRMKLHDLSVPYPFRKLQSLSQFRPPWSLRIRTASLLKPKSLVPSRHIRSRKHRDGRRKTILHSPEVAIWEGIRNLGNSPPQALPAVVALLVSQGHHGVDARGATRWDVAGQGSDRREHQRDEYEGQRISGADAVEQVAEGA